VDLPSVPCTQAGFFETFETRLGELQNLFPLDLEFNHFRVLLFFDGQLNEHFVQFCSRIKAQVEPSTSQSEPGGRRNDTTSFSQSRTFPSSTLHHVNWTNDILLLPADSLYRLQFYGISIDISKGQILAMAYDSEVEYPNHLKLVHKFASSCLKLKNLDLLLGARSSSDLKKPPSYSGYLLPINGLMSDMYLRALSMQNSTTCIDRQRREKVRGYQRIADRIREEMQTIAASKEDDIWKKKSTSTPHY
jgi:hypothetical protein